MELPSALRAAVDRALAGVPVRDLAAASGRLSQRYRAELRDGRFHLHDNLAALAYLATRLPATFAAISASLQAIEAVRPDFAPRTLLDVGAGPGSALWAARESWGSIEDAVLIEGSPAIRAIGERLSQHAGVASVTWHAADFGRDFPEAAPRDLVTLCYVLDELPPERRGPLIHRLWALTADMLVIVEPGTPAGWQRVLLVREQLIVAGAHVLAPCTHEAPCPLVAPDWCHFARRVARSRVHRLSKSAEVPWEDEKFIYFAASRFPSQRPGARVLSPPRAATGQMRLKLCERDGTAAERLFSKRDGDAFKAARRVEWGDMLG